MVPLCLLSGFYGPVITATSWTVFITGLCYSKQFLRISIRAVACNWRMADVGILRQKSGHMCIQGSMWQIVNWQWKILLFGTENCYQYKRPCVCALACILDCLRLWLSETAPSWLIAQWAIFWAWAAIYCNRKPCSSNPSLCITALGAVWDNPICGYSIKWQL